jgi:uncharacterized OB-fold protein
MVLPDRGQLAFGVMAAPRFDLPLIEDDTREFWDATREGRLLLRHCRACGEVHYYPRNFCPSCWSDDVDWVEAAGGASLYTWSTVYQNDLPPFHEQIPYVAAIVELDEGPRMMTKIVDCSSEQLAVGMRLRARFEPLDDDVTIVVFEPA